jgi:DNA-binding response OmpR family regulator
MSKDVLAFAFSWIDLRASITYVMVLTSLGAQPMQPLAESAFAGRRVLVVEDEYLLADDLREILVEHGAEVVGPAATLCDGIRMIEADNRIDFAVLDVQLQGENAFALSAALRDRKIPFVFTTGFGERKIPLEYQDVPRLEKPIETKALIAAMEAELGSQGLFEACAQKPGSPGSEHS